MIDVNLLMNISQSRRISKGTVIAKEGDFGEEMFIILQGTVGTFKNMGMPNQIQLETLTPGNFFGEMSLFLNKERIATFVALEDVVLMELNKVNTFYFFEKEPIATYSLIMTLCDRLYRINEKYESLQSSKAADSDLPAAPPEPEFTPETVKARLFPEGHKQYEIEFEEEGQKLLAMKHFTCPVCNKGFEADIIRKSMLRQIKTDNDLRIHYKGIEPIYYDVIACPHCRFCTFEDGLTNVVSQRADTARRELFKLTGGLYPDFNEKKDAETIFASYYLALHSANLCIRRPELIKARLWLRISWLYSDCGDADMEKYATEEALKAYSDVYQKVDLTEEQAQQVCLLIGELSFKTGDVLAAKNFLYLAKTNKSGSPAYRNIADIRLSEVKKLLSELTGK